MRHRTVPTRAGVLIVVLSAGAIALASCSTTDDTTADAGAAGTDATVTTESVAASMPSTPDTTVAPTVAPTTVVVTTTTEPVPVCVVAAQPGDSYSLIADRFGLTVNELLQENLLQLDSVVVPGQEFDVCIGDELDLSDPTLVEPPAEAVLRQQTELNELFSGTSMLPLTLDGDSGKLTRQAICAARMGLGLPVHNRNLVPGSDEEAAIFAATELSIPAGAPTDAAKWILIDQTCQVIVTGEGDERVVDVFPTSTGEEGHETFNVRARAVRFDPATDNDGWHDSSSFPVDVDNPLNGNMYKPIYFNDGQAIHGATYIPPFPRSKGCARTFPTHQDRIIQWLGLDSLTEATWNVRQIGVTVVVQGRYVELPELP